MADPWALRSAPWRRLGLGRGLRSPWRTKTPRSRSPQISKFASSNYLFFAFEFLFALRIVHGPRSMNFLPLKPCRPLGCHAKLTLESHAEPPDGTFVEKTPDQGNAVRYATWRVELWQRIRGIRRPIAARLRDFNETRAKGQRRMSGGVRDDQYFILQRRHQQQVDLRKDPGPFDRDLAAQSGGLEKIDRG